MNNDNFAESFDFNSHSWPPSGNITSTRFMSHDKYLAEGSFRICYLGHDTITQQRVVAKKFKEHNAMEDKYWTEDIGAARKAQEFATKFNAVMQTNKPIRFIQPIIDECAVNIHPPFVSGEKVLIEPYLGNDAYIKFNSNSGWENAHPVICSHQRQYGLTDLGEDGIRPFFNNHTCTGLCKSDWKRHYSPKNYSNVIQGTTFLF